MIGVLDVVKRGGRFRFRFVALLAIALGGAELAAACNDNPLITVPPCRPGLCTCEEDPAQQTCKGFNDRPEGGPVAPFDAGDAGDTRQPPIDGAVDAGSDALADADDDAG